MPQSFSDQVSVFHFTHRISSAKIRKYKIATERGMGAGGEAQRASSSGPLPTPAPQVAPAGTMHLGTPQPSESVPPTSASPPPATESPSMEPPAKKPKLKLKVREPQPSPAPAPAPQNDTIAVSRPKREVKLRMRYDENMVLDDESLRQHSPDESDLSSVEDLPPPPVRKPANEAVPKPAHPEYGNLMSYYIMDGEDDEPKAAAANPPPKAAAKTPRQSQSQHHHTAQMHNQAQMTNSQQRQYAPQDPRHMPNQQQRQQAPPANRLPPPPPPPPMPKVELVDFDFVGKIGGPKVPRTVLEMINRLAGLSAALTNFGGVPAAPSSPVEKKKEPETKKPKSDDAIDSFLGMFDDEEDSSGAEKEIKKGGKEEKDDEKDESQKLEYLLQNPGVPDGPLTYGIQFIQNALKSWAQQRLQHQHAAQWQQQAHLHNPQQQQPQKRGPGRPRKFPDENEERAQQNAKPKVIKVKAEHTPEGVAIKAFQQVLDSGVLQVNANLPQELTRALRNLYMQIDHLINQGSKNEPQWQCMSYGAQIAANKARVEKWKDAQAKAQEEMARQQQLAQQQVLQQMGLPTTQPQQLTQAQLQHAHMVELERKRSVQHAAQQPYISQHHLNPLLLGSQPPGTPVGYAPSPSPANGAPSGTPARRSSTPGSAVATPNGLPKPQSPANANSEQQQQQMEKMTMYVPGYTSRPGTQMKFSFAPSNEHAVQVWGANAFPSNSSQGPNIPNRGPMIGSPTNAQAQAHGSPVKAPSEAASAMIVPSIESTNGAAHQSNGHADSDVEMTGVNEVNGGGKEQIVVKKELGIPAAIQTNGFNAVNKGAVMPASPAQASSAATVSKMNGQGGGDMASRFPHPGAIVVDQ